ncbi:MAG: cell division protein FtsA [Salinivirgaceae bacterium]|nr:cell division protein FtsA [Salinivirgaceae bacterium]
MDENKIVAAIDVGTTKIVALIGRKNEHGSIDILGYGRTESRGMKRGAVLNIEEVTTSIASAVSQAEAEANMKITEAYIGIAGQHIRSQCFNQPVNRNSANDAISQAEVDALTNQMREVPREMGEEILHILPQSYTVDNVSDIKNPVGISGKQFIGNFHIVFGKTAAANNLRSCVEKNGIKVKGLILEPLASSTAVLTEDDKDLGVALVDIGGGTTDIAIFCNGRICYTAVIPCGGNIVTSDIKQGCKIIEKDAEDLKIQYGSAIETEKMKLQMVSIPGHNGMKPKEISVYNLARFIRARMEEIIATVAQIIEVSGTKNKLGAGIVITGGGSSLKNLRQLFALRTGMEIRIGLPNKRVDNQEMITNLPSNATAIGLMTMGIEDMKIKELSFEKNSSATRISDKKDETDSKTSGNTQEEAAKEPEKGGKAGEKIKKMWGKFTNWATVIDDENV